MSSPAERGALVGGIAAECERAAQLDWAIELYLYAGQAGAALALINDQLSNALQPALSSSASGMLFCSGLQALLSSDYMKFLCLTRLSLLDPVFFGIGITYDSIGTRKAYCIAE